MPCRAPRCAVPLALALVAIAPAEAAEHAQDERVVVLRGAELRTVANGTIPQGALVVRGAHIDWVGPEAELELPDGATVQDVSGLVIVPGLVDTHSHVGIYPRPATRAHADGNELTGPIQSQLRAMDAIWPEDPGIRMAAAGGITTAHVMPGSGNVVGGQTAVVKLRGETIEEMMVPLPDGHVGGLKMANGENVKRVYGTRNQAPATRMATAALARELFEKAKQYREKQRSGENGEREPVAGGGADEKLPSSNLALDPIVEVLEGTRTVHHHTHRADDIATVLRLQREYGFDVVIQHGTEAWKLADRLAEAGIPVSLIVTDSPGGKFELGELRHEAAGILERAGVRVSLHTDDYVNPSRLFLRLGGLAVRGGMSEDAALHALTLEPARQLKLDARLGSLEAGKDADFVVLSGPPFSIWTHVLETWIEGERVFDRADPAQRRFATGGFAVRDRYPEVPPRPPGEDWP